MDPLRPWMYAVLSVAYLAGAFAVQSTADSWLSIIFGFGSGGMAVLGLAIRKLERR
jgi:hypothetical protein